MDQRNASQRGIAIVGMACVYPGAHSPEELWQNALAGRRSFRIFPDERLPRDQYHDVDPEAPGKTYADKMAVITGWSFDPVAVRIPPITFQTTDIAHWLALHTALEAVRDSGLNVKDLDRSRFGAIIGNTLTGEFSRSSCLRFRWPYVQRAARAAMLQQGYAEQNIDALLGAFAHYFLTPFPEINEDTLAGNMANTIAGRICNHFDLGGGGFTVDGACSSSLLSIAHACNALVNRDLDYALAGGVDISLDPFEVVGFAKTKALAADDIRPYDERAAGMLPGEGCGLFVLMREEDAREQGRCIHAVVRGWAYSSDGSGGITAPRVEGQMRALQKAYERAGYSIGDVQLFEGHGTGTKLGDEVEIKAIRNLLEQAGTERESWIGSIKGDIGHCKAAAGAAGLIKAVMALKRKIIPPTGNCTIPGRVFGRPTGGLRPALHGMPWSVASGPRRASVSAMGFGGANAHVTIEEASSEGAASEDDLNLLRSSRPTELILLSGSTLQELAEKVAVVARTSGRMSRAELIDLSAALAGEQHAGMWRIAVVAESPWRLSQQLADIAQRLAAGRELTEIDDPDEGIFAGRTKDHPWFVALFPGQGSQRLNMGADALRRHVRVRDLARSAETAVAGMFPGGLLDRMQAVSHELDQQAWEQRIRELQETRVAQPAIVLASLAQYSMLRLHGLTPGVCIGHSLGEISALSAAGAIEPGAAVLLAAHRGRIMASLATGTKGAMAAIGADPVAVDLLIRAHAPELTIANYNSLRQTVVSGLVDDIEKFIAACTYEEVRAVRLPVSHAFHSPAVRPAAEEFRQVLGSLQITEISRRVISTSSGRAIAPADDLRMLLAEQISSPVRFLDAVNLAAEQQPDFWLEVGPGGVLSGLVRDILGERAECFPLDLKEEDGATLLQRAMGRAFVLGCVMETRSLFAERFFRPISPYEYTPLVIVNPCERPVAPLEQAAGRSGLVPRDLIPAGVQDDAFRSYLEQRSGYLRELIALDYRYNADAPPPSQPKPLTAAPAPSMPPEQDVVRYALDWIAKRTGYPRVTLTPSLRLREDLNLDSIKAGELALILARRMKVTTVPDPGKFANASIADIVGHLRQVAGTSAASTNAAETSIPSVEAVNSLGDWNQVFRITTREHPVELDLAAPLQKGRTAVIAATVHDARSAMVASLLHEAGLRPVPAGFPASEEQTEFADDTSVVIVLLQQNGGSFDACTDEEFDLRVEGLGASLFTMFRRIARQKDLSSVRCVVVRPYEPENDKEADLDAGAAFLKSLTLEYAGFAPKWLCLPNTWSAERWADVILRELRTASPKVWFQYREDGMRMTDAAVMPEPAPKRAGRDGNGGVLLATGGARGITFELASAFARATGASLGLIGSSPAPGNVAGDAAEEMTRNFRELEQEGIRFAYASCDVTDRTALKSAVDAVQAALGPVTAILHGAGVTRPAPFNRMELRDFLSCIRVKARGLRNLLVTIPAGQLREVQVLSSVLGRTGMAGQVDYTFANAWLDGAVQVYCRDHLSTNGFSIGYSVWSEAGLGKRMGAAATLGALGVVPVSTERGVAMYLEVALGGYEGTFIGTGRLTPSIDAALYAPPSGRRGRFLDRILRFAPGAEIVVESRLSHALDRYLPEHVFEGTALMPGVMGIEAMVSAAMIVAGSDRLPELSGVRFLRPLIVPEDAPVAVRILGLVTERSGDRMSVRIAVRSESDGFQGNHFEAVCRFGDERAGEHVSLPLMALPEAIPLPLGAHEPLPLFQGKLFRRITALRELTPGVRSITEIRVPDGAVYFGPGLPGATKTPAPAVRDSCLQSGGLMLSEMCLPAGIAKIKWHRDFCPGEDLTCVSEITGKDESGYRTTILLYDAVGSLVEELHGVLFTPTRLGAAPREPAGTSYPRLAEEGGDIDYLFRAFPFTLAAIMRRDEEVIPALSAAAEHDRIDHCGLAATQAAAAVFARKRLGLQVSRDLFSVKNDPSGKPHLAVAEQNLAAAFSGIDLSLSDGGNATLACVGPAPVGVDIEPVEMRDAELWLGLLGEDGYDLARRIKRSCEEPFDVSATRVWTLIEAGKKAASLRRMIPELVESGTGGQVSFIAKTDGLELRFSSTIVSMNGDSRLAALCVAAGTVREASDSVQGAAGGEASGRQGIEQEIKSFFGALDRLRELSATDPVHTDAEMHYTKFNEFFSAVLERFENLTCNLQAGERRAIQTGLSRRLLAYIREYVDSIPFRRALEKPLGYPGDYYLMDLMLKQQVTTKGIGYHFDRKFIEYSGSEGVRQRTYWVVNHLHDRLKAKGGRELAVLDMGCGPMTIESLFAEAAGSEVRLRFMGLDIDSHAVSHARERIKSPNSSVEIRICNLLGQDGIENIQEFAPLADICICMGFFDYLDPETISLFLEGVRTRLKPGTPVLFANYKPDHDARLAMEWLLDWWLVYKTEQEMRMIAERAGFQPKSVRTLIESSESIVLVEAIA